MKRPSDDGQPFSLSDTIAFVDSLEHTVDELRIHTRRSDVYPFDTVAGEMLSKAFALSRASILLIQNGYPDEAFGLCRSLYDCSIYLRYITLQHETRDERANKFLEFGVTSKAFWFDLLDKNSPLKEAEREDIARYKVENRIPNDPKRITQPWSDVRKLIERISKETHPTDADYSTEALRSKERAISYTDTSSYVHCTQPGLNAYSFDWKEPITVRKSRSSSSNTGFKTCMVIQVHLRAVARYSLFGMGVISLEGSKRKEYIAADILGTVDEER